MTELFLSLATFALVATLSPGGATTLATASGVQFGLRRSLPLLAGIALGLGALVALVSTGLGTLVLAHPAVVTALRIAGTAYFLWLAWRIARQGAPGSGPAARTAPLGFFAGALLLWANPKGWSMAVATAAGFAGLAESPLLLAAILGAVFATAASLSLSLWCMGGAWLGRLLRSERQWRAVNLSLAALLLASVVLLWR